MSDSAQTPLINIIPKSMDNALDNLAGPPTRAVGESLKDIWYLIMGGPLQQAALKREMRYAVEAEKFREEISKKVSEIPENKRVEPNFQTASLAFENAKYCLDAEELRQLFCNLIAATVDEDKANAVHPVFSEIIKKMSPRDASNLKSFGNCANYPIAKYRQWHGNTGYVDICKNIFLQNKQYSDVQDQSISINVLCSLGLTSVTYEKKFDSSSYTDFYKNDTYIAFNDMCKQHNQTTYPKVFPDGMLAQFSQEHLNKIHEQMIQPQRLEVIGGMIELTDLGSVFKHICIGE